MLTFLSDVATKSQSEFIEKDLNEIENVEISMDCLCLLYSKYMILNFMFLILSMAYYVIPFPRRFVKPKTVIK